MTSPAPAPLADWELDLYTPRVVDPQPVPPSNPADVSYANLRRIVRSENWRPIDSVALAAEAAELAVPMFEREVTDDLRPRAAAEFVRSVVDGVPVNRVDLQDATNAAGRASYVTNHSSGISACYVTQYAGHSAQALHQEPAHQAPLYTSRYALDAVSSLLDHDVDGSFTRHLGEWVTARLATLPVEQEEELACECRQCTWEAGDDIDCENCGDMYRQNGRDDANQYHCGYCQRQLDEQENERYFDDNGYVRNYSYRPTCNFLKADDDPDDKLFMGWELEVPSDESHEFAESIYNGPGQEESVLYCKEDGSIDGVEIVSHPMTHKYFSEKFPFEMFKRDSDQSGYMRGRPPSNYGLHVHVSRAGFKNEAHALRWLLLIYRNDKDMSLLARRTSGEWAAFSDSAQLIAKSRGDSGYERYVAVNGQNRDTFEIRVFRSTWSVQKFRAAIDFAHASVLYTRGLKVGDALRGALDWSKFRAWVDERPQYINLTKEFNRLYAIPEGE